MDWRDGSVCLSLAWAVQCAWMVCLKTGVKTHRCACVGVCYGSTDNLGQCLVGLRYLLENIGTMYGLYMKGLPLACKVNRTSCILSGRALFTVHGWGAMKKHWPTVVCIQCNVAEEISWGQQTRFCKLITNVYTYYAESCTGFTFSILLPCLFHVSNKKNVQGGVFIKRNLCTIKREKEIAKNSMSSHSLWKVVFEQYAYNGGVHPENSCQGNEHQNECLRSLE